jgi:hypothetical protein
MILGDKPLISAVVLSQGEPERKYFLKQAKISNNEVVVLFDPVKLVYEVKSSSRTSVGGEVLGGRIF